MVLFPKFFMKTVLKFVPVFPVIVLLGCSNPADKVPEAKATSMTSTPATETKPAEAPATAARSYVINPENSSINFIGSKITGSHNGGFAKFVGELRIVNGNLAGAGNKIVIETASLYADNPRLTGHLKSRDFFNVAEIPTATFETTAITQNETNSTVTGNLTLHGITKQISFPATITVSEATVEVTADFFINRFDFEIKYPGKANDLIRKEVVLKLKVKATPGSVDFQTTGKQAAAL